MILGGTEKKNGNGRLGALLLLRNLFFPVLRIQKLESFRLGSFFSFLWRGKWINKLGKEVGGENRELEEINEYQSYLVVTFASQMT